APAQAADANLASVTGTALIMVVVLGFWALYRTKLHHPKTNEPKDQKLKVLDLVLAMLLGMSLMGGLLGNVGQNLLNTGNSTIASIAGNVSGNGTTTGGK